MEKGISKVEYLNYFIDLIKRLDFRIEILCLDREFYTVDVFDFLQKQNVPYIVPVVKKGFKIKEMLIGNKGRTDTSTMEKTIEKIIKKVELDIVIDVEYIIKKRKNGALYPVADSGYCMLGFIFIRICFCCLLPYLHFRCMSNRYGLHFPL